MPSNCKATPCTTSWVGGSVGITAVISGVADNLVADPRISGFFHLPADPATLCG